MRRRILQDLEARTRDVCRRALRESTLPAAVKEAASANLSTLATTTCFRTADGEFHGFEGSNDTRGMLLWQLHACVELRDRNAFLFPSVCAVAAARAPSATRWTMRARFISGSCCPTARRDSGFAAADGQMGQIIHAWLDWKICGDERCLRALWPRVKKAIEFAWVPGGWDANRDGVMEGVQHNTYDVEFYGPNPMCGIYYLGASTGRRRNGARGRRWRVCAETYQRLFEKGSQWIDANLFNGEFYIQKVADSKRMKLRRTCAATWELRTPRPRNTRWAAAVSPISLIGQYLADVGGHGTAGFAGEHSHRRCDPSTTTTTSPRWRTTIMLQRTYALNDEAAVVVCDYGKAERPHIPFPYYAESWTGQEYLVASIDDELGHGGRRRGVR